MDKSIHKPNHIFPATETLHAEAIAKAAEPAMRWLLLLAFWKEVFEPVFSAPEQQRWAIRMESDAEHELPQMIREIEDRTGKDMQKTLRTLSSRIAEEYSQTILNTVMDMQKIEKLGIGTQLADDLKAGNVQGVHAAFTQMAEMQHV